MREVFEGSRVGEMSTSMVFCLIGAASKQSSAGLNGEIGGAWVEEFERLCELTLCGEGESRAQAEGILSSLHRREDSIDLLRAVMSHSKREDAALMSCLLLKRSVIFHWCHSSQSYRYGGGVEFEKKMLGLISELVQQHVSSVFCSSQMYTQVCVLVGGLLKKGATGSEGSSFLNFYEEIIARMTQCDHEQTLSKLLPLLDESCKELGSPASLGTLRISWEKHQSLKKICETRVLLALLVNLRQLMKDFLQGSRRTSLGEGNTSSGVVAEKNPLTSTCKLLETCLDWDFSTCRAPGLSQIEPWFAPPPTWETLFYPQQDTDLSLLFIIVNLLDSARRHDLRTQKTTCSDFLTSAYFLLQRMCKFRPTYAWRSIAGKKFQQESDRKEFLTLTIYTPILQFLVQIPPEAQIPELKLISQTTLALLTNPNLLINKLPAISYLNLAKLCTALIGQANTESETSDDALEALENTLKCWNILMEDNGSWTEESVASAGEVVGVFLEGTENSPIINICEKKEENSEANRLPLNHMHPDLREFLRIFGSFMRSSIKAIEIFANHLSTQIELVQKARMSSDISPATLEATLDKMGYLLYLSAYLLVSSSADLFIFGADVPREFAQLDSHKAAVMPILSRIFAYIQYELDVAKEGKGNTVALLERSLIFVARFIPAYLFNDLNFPHFADPDEGQKVLSMLVGNVGQLLHFLPMEPRLMEFCTFILQEMCSWNSLCLGYLWENLVYQELLSTAVHQICSHEYLCSLFPGAGVSPYEGKHGGPLRRLNCKNLKRLGHTFASSATSSPAMKNIVRQKISRSATLLTDQVVQQRQIQLLQIAQPLKDSLNWLSQLPSEGPHPLVLDAISIDLALAAGLAQSAAKFSTEAAVWFVGLIHAVTSILKHNLLHPPIVSSTLKFLRCVTTSLFKNLTDTNLAIFLSDIQAVVEMFVKAYEGRVLSKEDENDLCGNVAQLLRLLQILAVEEPHLDNREIGQKVQMLIVLSLKQLVPITARPSIINHNKALTAYVVLEQTVIERTPVLFLESFDISSIEAFGRVLQVGIFSSSNKIRNPTYETLHSVSSCLVDRIVLLGDVCTDVHPPPGYNDLFAKIPEVIHSFTRALAEIGLKILTEVFIRTPDPKGLEWYSDALFDIFYLISIKAYNLEVFFKRFCSTYRTVEDSNINQKCGDLVRSSLSLFDYSATQKNHFDSKFKFRQQFALFIFEAAPPQ